MNKKLSQWFSIDSFLTHVEQLLDPPVQFHCRVQGQLKQMGR